MSNGVGVLAALSGSIPEIPGPRPAKPAPELPPDLRPPAIPPDLRRPPVRPPDPAPPRRLRVETAAARPVGLHPVSPAGPPRAEPIVVQGVATRDLVRRLAEAVRSAPVRDGACIRMSLRPAHLGELWIELVLVGSRLRGRVRTETEAARDLLRSRLDDLRMALKKLGIDIRDFEVEVGREAAEAPERRPRSHRRQILDFRA